ncbi:MAG: NosD domain-containing protein [Owenweeksia sp.]|nr:NosD domain-containing protein [Owenweeksia sp.]
MRPIFRFFETLAQAQSAAGLSPDHVDKPRYIRDANSSNTPAATHFYVYDFPDTAMTIQAAVDAAVPGNTLYVDAGIFEEDVLLNKAISLQGNGIGISSIIGPKGGDGATIRITADGAVVDGFTITRFGNNLAEWNDPTLNFAGIAIQGQSARGEVSNCALVGNRTAIDINNSNGNNIHNNRISLNHTGLIFRNQTDNTDLQENDIVDNRTMGILFFGCQRWQQCPGTICAK